MLGVVSYSLYATHRLAFGVMNLTGFSGQSALILKPMLAIAFAIAIAHFFYVLVEKKSLDFSVKFRVPRVGNNMAKGNWH
jgi:peptidoglycan/LPS O-acetylase OafA/YrhL